MDTNGQLFKKVYIETEADLPKGNRTMYFVGVKDNLNTEDIYEWFNYENPIMSDNQAEYWLNTFDWYLQPIEEKYNLPPFKFCPGCGKDWEFDSEEFGCWSCGYSKVKITKIPESKPIYDEAYLNECIAKAMPNLSKINDVDKHLAEIRGEQESISDKNIEREVQEYLKNTHYPVSKREARILLITFAGMMRDHPEQFKTK